MLRFNTSYYLKNGLYTADTRAFNAVGKSSEYLVPDDKDAYISATESERTALINFVNPRLESGHDIVKYVGSYLSSVGELRHLVCHNEVFRTCKNLHSVNATRLYDGKNLGASAFAMRIFQDTYYVADDYVSSGVNDWNVVRHHDKFELFNSSYEEKDLCLTFDYKTEVLTVHKRVNGMNYSQIESINRIIIGLYNKVRCMLVKVGDAYELVLV